VFDSHLWQTTVIWEDLKKTSAQIRERSLRTYLNLVAAATGAGYLTLSFGKQTLIDAFIDRIPYWFKDTSPDLHAKIAVTAWNIAEGARNQAIWLEQYLLTRAYEFDDPLTLEQQTLELLKPVLEPSSPAAWKGPFTVKVLDIFETDRFLPGKISAVTPRFIHVANRLANEQAIGVLLFPRGESKFIGELNDSVVDTESSDSTCQTSPDIPVTWTEKNVTVGKHVVDLPLMGCKPLHTLVLPGGYLVAAVQNSQRLWIVETP
jgi:hypothetical protein